MVSSRIKACIIFFDHYLVYFSAIGAVMKVIFSCGATLYTVLCFCLYVCLSTKSGSLCERFLDSSRQLLKGQNKLWNILGLSRIYWSQQHRLYCTHRPICSQEIMLISSNQPERPQILTIIHVCNLNLKIGTI